jgi:hypothetical protein
VDPDPDFAVIIVDPDPISLKKMSFFLLQMNPLLNCLCLMVGSGFSEILKRL